MRSTQRTQWLPKVVRYNEWKGHVVAKFIDHIESLSKEERDELKPYINFLDKKPIIATSKKIYVKIYVTFKDKAHGDGDNIFKGIADALFMNDKYVAGSFDYEYSKDKQGKIYIQIIL